jgi:PleD family two-component response regulator
MNYLGRNRLLLRTKGMVKLPVTTTVEGVRVLAVDDQQEACEVLAGFLSECGAVVTAVSSGSEALLILLTSRTGAARRPHL